jgi:hypothetical protein
LVSVPCESHFEDARALAESSLSWDPVSGRAISGPSQPFSIHPTLDSECFRVRIQYSTTDIDSCVCERGVHIIHFTIVDSHGLRQRPLAARSCKGKLSDTLLLLERYYEVQQQEPKGPLVGPPMRRGPPDYFSKKTHRDYSFAGMHRVSKKSLLMEL